MSCRVVLLIKLIKQCPTCVLPCKHLSCLLHRVRTISSSTCWLDCLITMSMLWSAAVHSCLWTYRSSAAVCLGALSPASGRTWCGIPRVSYRRRYSLQSALQGVVTYVDCLWCQHRFVANMSCLIFVSFLELAEVRFYDKEVHIRIRKQKENNHSVP